MSPVITFACIEQPEQMLLDHLTQSVFLKDDQGRFVAVNRAFCDGLNHAREEILGRDDFAFYPRGLAEKYRADDLRILTEGITLEFEEQNVRKESLRSVRVVKSPVRGPDHAIQGILGIFWDVTEQRQLEAQLRQAQKMTAIAQLAGGIAHDFNNLLTGVIGNLSLARLELARGPESRIEALADLISHADSACQRAAELTRQLLTFSKRLQPRPEPMQLNDLAREALAAQPIPSEVSLAMHLDSHLGKVRADAGQLRQVVRHLLTHARDAIARGGTLTIQTNNVTLVPEAATHRPIPSSKSTMILPLMHHEARTGDFVRLRVSYGGGGIATDDLEHLFEPFFATKGLGHGAGLGLAMAASIAKDHDGWLECHHQHDTRFDLYLPRLLEST